MKPLALPPAALADADAVQMISAWIAENGMHCSLKIGMWQSMGIDEPGAWGKLLADVVRHIADAHHQEFGKRREDTLNRVVSALLAELDAPTSERRGGFSAGAN